MNQSHYDTIMSSYKKKVTRHTHTRTHTHTHCIWLFHVPREAVCTNIISVSPVGKMERLNKVYLTRERKTDSQITSFPNNLSLPPKQKT